MACRIYLNFNDIYAIGAQKHFLEGSFFADSSGWKLYLISPSLTSILQAAFLRKPFNSVFLHNCGCGNLPLYALIKKSFGKERKD